MRVLIRVAVLSTAFQIAAIILAVMLAQFTSELPLVAIMFFYLPAILLVQASGNFVGCGNMIEPMIYGIPLGIASYSLLFGYSARLVNHLTRRRKTQRS